MWYLRAFPSGFERARSAVGGGSVAAPERLSRRHCPDLPHREDRKAPLEPYPESASTQPKRAPEAMTRSISSIAISGFVRAVCLSFGTRARAMRSGSSVQLSGRNSRRLTITGTSRDANVTETSDWQLAVFPSDE